MENVLSAAPGGGCSSCEALQQERLHREPWRASLLSGPHVQPRRLDAALQTHLESGAQHQLLWSRPRCCLIQHIHQYSPACVIGTINALLCLNNPDMWPLPLCVDLVYNDVFWKGCLPGSQGNLCKVCMGGSGEAATRRCADNHNERYYGNMGALR